MAFNEDSRVKIPAILHLTRLGYEYIPKYKHTDVNTNNVLQNFYWGSDKIYYAKFKIFIKDGTYTITNVITGQVSQGFYNDFNELRFLINKTYSTPMVVGGQLSVSVSNFKKI